MLTNGNIKEKFENLVKIAGFKEITILYSYVPIFSSTIPIGICHKV